MSVHGVDRPTRKARSHPSNGLLALAQGPRPSIRPVDGARPLGRLYVTADERRKIVLDLVNRDRSTTAVARENGLPSRLVQRWLDEFLDELCRTLA